MFLNLFKDQEKWKYHLFKIKNLVFEFVVEYTIFYIVQQNDKFYSKCKYKLRNYLRKKSNRVNLSEAVVNAVKYLKSDFKF